MLRNVHKIDPQLTKPTVTYNDIYLICTSFMVKNHRGFRRVMNYLSMEHGYSQFYPYYSIDYSTRKYPKSYPSVVDYYHHFEGGMCELVFKEITMDKYKDLLHSGYEMDSLLYLPNDVGLTYIGYNHTGLYTTYLDDVYCINKHKNISMFEEVPNNIVKAKYPTKIKAHRTIRESKFTFSLPNGSANIFSLMENDDV